MKRPDLPNLVATHLARNLVDRPHPVPDVLLHQAGEMRLSPTGGWLPFTAEQRIETASTGFVWHARVKMAPMVTAVVDDAYENGKGRLDARVWGVLPVAHGRGPDIDRGEAQRYLAELPWNPMAFLYNEALNYETIGARTVRVWVVDPDTWVDLSFGVDGDIRSTRTETRVRGDSTQPWVGHFDDYRDFGPFRAPFSGEVWWEPPGEERFVYWRGQVTEIEWVDPAG